MRGTIVSVGWTNALLTKKVGDKFFFITLKRSKPCSIKSAKKTVYAGKSGKVTNSLERG